MANFDRAFGTAAKTRDGEMVSTQLRPLLHDVYTQVVSPSKDLAALKKSLIVLLEFLRDEGRTNANCWAVDLFFAESDRWECDWTEQKLPEDFHDIFAMMSEALHDTVQASSIAENFGCLPEQLLSQINKLQAGAAQNEGQS